jgi:hypothetical protein
MSTTAKDTGKNIIPPPAGTHRARCFAVIDLGTQQTTWNNRVIWQEKILLGWELSDEFYETEEGLKKPHIVWQRYTNSLANNANLRADLESWRGIGFRPEELKGFKVEKVLGKACLLTLIHKEKDGKTYANITAITPLPKGTPAPPELLTKPIHYQIEDGENDTFKSLSAGLQSVIASCKEWQPGHEEEPRQSRDSEEDNIPF